VGLDPPVPRLRRRLRDEGFDYPESVVTGALFAEMRFYREHLDEGRDADSLADLRRRCAEVLAEGLPDAPPLDLLTPWLVDNLEFTLLPDAVPALDALRDRGHRLAMVSNWDYTLPDELERLGISHYFEVVAVSATLGVAKPDPRIFHHALQALGVEAGDAVHCGDHPEKDCEGARAAGIRAVLVDREGRFPDAACRRIESLTGLPDAIELTLRGLSGPVPGT
jgi:putative hydrolase of the HAD superfamily